MTFIGKDGKRYRLIAVDGPEAVIPLKGKRIEFRPFKDDGEETR